MIWNDVFILVNHEFFKLTKNVATVDPLKEKIHTIKLARDDYPLELIKDDEIVFAEFQSIVCDKHRSTWQSDEHSLIILERSEQSLRDEKIDVFEWSKKLKFDLEKFQNHHFISHEILKEKMAASLWHEAVGLIRMQRSERKIHVLNESSQSVELYGLKKNMNQVMDSITKLKERESDEMTLKELVNLESWQTSYFKQIETSLDLDKSLRVTVADDKISVVGSRKLAEQAVKRIEHLVKSFLKEALALDTHLFAYFSFQPNWNRLNELVHRVCGLEVSLINTNKDIYLIYTDSRKRECCKSLVDERFTCEKLDFKYSASLQLVESRRFDEFLAEQQKELKIDTQLIKQMVHVNNEDVICVGEKHLVKKLSKSISMFFDSNQVYL